MSFLDFVLFLRCISIHCPWFKLMHSFMMMIFVDSLCEEERMNRNYCTESGSYKTASLGKCSFGNMRNKFCSVKLVCAMTQLDSTAPSWWRTSCTLVQNTARIIAINQWKEIPAHVSRSNLQCVNGPSCPQKLGREEVQLCTTEKEDARRKLFLLCSNLSLLLHTERQ